MLISLTFEYIQNIDATNKCIFMIKIKPNLDFGTKFYAKYDEHKNFFA